MRARKRGLLLGMVTAVSALLVAACGPAQPTSTTGAQPTSTTGAQLTSTTAVQPTATQAVAAMTATTAATASSGTPESAKLRVVPVVAAPPPNPQAQRGGTFRWLNNLEPANFGVWDSAIGTTLQTAVPAFDTLLDTNEYQDGKQDQILPSMAYDWWTDQAGTTWTFKLKQGIKFTDGQEMTCADVKFSLETIRDGRDSTGSQLVSSPRATYLRRVKSVTCPDDHTVTIQTNGPLPSLIKTLALTTFSIYPKHFFEGNLPAADTQIGPGEGSFMFDSYKPTESLTLKRNPNYWQQPYPFLDVFQILNLGSATAVTSAFEVGRGEYAGISSVSTLNRLETQGKVFVIHKGASDSFVAVHTNWRKAPWNDPRFALALRCAIDGQKAINTAMDGLGFEGPTFPLADTPGGSQWSITKQQWAALGPCYGPTSETNMAQRQQMAKDLLAQMGFTAQNPAKLDVEWWNVSTLPAIGQSIQADLTAVGIQTEFIQNATSAYYSKAGSGSFNIIPGGFATSRRDPDPWLYEHYYSTSDRNYGKYTNAEVDAMIDKQSQTLDPVARKAIIDQISIQLLKDNAKIVVFHVVTQRAYAVWVKDMYWGQPNNSQSTGAKFARTWIDQEVMKRMAG